MPELLPSPQELPAGAHGIALYASPAEAARQMARFLRGARDLAQPERYSPRTTTSSASTRTPWARSRRRCGRSSTASPVRTPIRPRTGSARRRQPCSLRPPIPRARACVGTRSPATSTGPISDRYLRYEAWFDSLRPFRHRAMCPYDLTRLPLDRATEAFARLASAHTHAVLSDDPNPGVRLLQLLLVPHLDRAPVAQDVYLRRAIDARLIAPRPGTRDVVGLTLRGQQLVRALVGLRL